MPVRSSVDSAMRWPSPSVDQRVKRCCSSGSSSTDASAGAVAAAAAGTTGSTRSGSQRTSQPAMRCCSGQNSSTPPRLNRVWNSASCNRALSPKPASCDMASMVQVSGTSSSRARLAVATLKITWNSASRWPPRLLPSMPTKAVLTLLPTLEPIARARLWSSCSWPPASAARASISTAWVDCSTTVATMPTSTNSRVWARPVAPLEAKPVSPLIASKPARRPSMPRKMKATPSSTRPAALPRGPAKLPSTPNTTSGQAIGERLKSCPASASSQMPVVAPRLAPRRMEMPPASWIRPEPRKAMVSSETRVEDCSAVVPAMPNSRPRTGVPVLRASIRSRPPPASWRRPSSRHCMPNRNIASPAHSCSQPSSRQKLQPSAAASSTNSGRRNLSSFKAEIPGEAGQRPLSAGSPGVVSKHWSLSASRGAAVVRASGLSQSTGICRLRGEPRQCGLLA